MTRWRILIALVFLACCQIENLHAQLKDFKTDWARVTKMKDDTNKVKLLNSIFDKYYFGEVDSAKSGFLKIKESYLLAVKLDYTEGIISSSFRLGQSLNQIKSKDKAIEYFFICIKKAEENKSYKYYYKSIMYLGLIHYLQRKWKTALSYFVQVQEMKHNIAEKATLQTTCDYLAGLCYLELSEYKNAEILLFKALKIAIKNNDSARKNECFVALGKINAGKGNFKLARAYFDTALTYYQSNRDKVALALIYEKIANIYNIQNRKDSALQFALKAYSEGKGTPAALNLAEITQLLQKLYFEKGDFNKAYFYLLENNNIKDSIYTKDISTEIALAQNYYEFQKKETKFKSEIQERENKKNQAYILAGITGLFLIIVAFAFSSVRKERRKSEKLLLNILPVETASELKKYGKAIPRRHESATIMFCDVKQFTIISESLSPETLVAMLDSYITKFDEIISEFGLEKIKTIGDAYMCAGGLHSGFDDHPVKTVRAGLAILSFVSRTKAEMEAKFGHSFQFRIGIHTGPLVSGVVGFHKYAYDVWGDTVNIAARMEEKSEPGQINVSGVTYTHIINEFKATYRGKIEAKNKAPMEMYFIETAIS
jgi:class 3 adenylate cyclase